jgi:hypothetical protein
MQQSRLVLCDSCDYAIRAGLCAIIKYVGGEMDLSIKSRAGVELYHGQTDGDAIFDHEPVPLDKASIVRLIDANRV